MTLEVQMSYSCQDNFIAFFWGYNTNWEEADKLGTDIINTIKNFPGKFCFPSAARYCIDGTVVKKIII